MGRVHGFITLTQIPGYTRDKQGWLGVEEEIDEDTVREK